MPDLWAMYFNRFREILLTHEESRYVKAVRFLGLRFENLSLRVSGGKEINYFLDGSVCFLISGMKFAGGCVDLGGFAVEETVGQWAADALVKEGEHEGDRMPLSVSR